MPGYKPLNPYCCCLASLVYSHFTGILMKEDRTRDTLRGWGSQGPARLGGVGCNECFEKQGLAFLVQTDHCLQLLID